MALMGQCIKVKKGPGHCFTPLLKSFFFFFFVVYDRKLDEYYAMKIEPYNTKARRELSSLQAVTYKEGFLELVDYFKTEFNTLHIVFTLVGTTLHDYIRTFNHKKVDLRTVVLLADQLVSLPPLSPFLYTDNVISLDLPSIYSS